MLIQRDSKVPFYYQLYEILQGKIIRGEWQPGELIPSESELLEQYEVSRSTVRQALDMLVQDGLIYRQRGRGSFVAQPTVEQGLSRIISFTEDMRQRGMRPETKVISTALVNAPEDIARRLHIDVGEEVAHLERLRLADSEPLSVEETFLIHRYCQGVLSNDYARQPLRETLARDYGLRLVYARQTIRAIAASKDLASKLMIEAHAPVLYIQRVSYTDKDIPVEFIRFYHRGDRYVLYNELRD